MALRATCAAKERDGGKRGNGGVCGVPGRLKQHMLADDTSADSFTVMICEGLIFSCVCVGVCRRRGFDHTTRPGPGIGGSPQRGSGHPPITEAVSQVCRRAKKLPLPACTASQHVCDCVFWSE